MRAFISIGHSCRGENTLIDRDLSLHSFNPFTLRAAKRGLTILEIFHLQKHSLGNIWRRNVDQKPNHNSPSIILLTFALFTSYFQKYESSRRYLLEILWVLMGHSCTGENTLIDRDLSLLSFNPFTLRTPLEPNVCYSHTFENNFRTKRKLTKYLMESCSLASDKHFSFKCFPENAFESNIFPNLSGLFWLLWVLMG